MEKFMKKYGVIIMLYFVIICGIILLNERLRLLNQGNIMTGVTVYSHSK